MADIEVNGTSIGQRDFEIEIGISDKVVAPTAQFEARTRESVTAGDDVDILLDGTTRFSGLAVSGGTIDRSGQRTVSCEHPAAALFADAVTLDETGPPTDEAVLQAALTAAEDGADFTLDYAGTATTLQSAYTATTRSVKSIFRDMTDRTGRVWWVEPAGTTIHVEPRGDRGTFTQFTEASGEGRVDRFEEGSVDTVKNDIVVNATAGENVTGTAVDTTSITAYGRRAEVVNIGYADTQAEANAHAQSLLTPDPVPRATVRLNRRAGTIAQPLANFQIDIQSDPKGIDADGLTVTKQLLTQGQTTLEVGRGAGVNFQGRNRRTKSREDTTEPGTVYNTDRIAADAITVNELDALDLDVGDVTITNPSTGSQVDFFGNVNGAIAIEPTGGVALGSPFSDAFQAAFIDEIFPPADNDGLVGSSTTAYDEMHAYDFIDAGSGASLQDEIDDNASDISNNDADIADLEQRVSDLESQ